MKLLYRVHSFDENKLIIQFQILSINDFINIQFNTKDEYMDYRGVNPKYHYRHVETGDIVIYKPEIDVRICIPQISDNSGTYIKANQCDFDKWHIKEYPDSSNARIYNEIEKYVNRYTNSYRSYDSDSD